MSLQSLLLTGDVNPPRIAGSPGFGPARTGAGAGHAPSRALCRALGPGEGWKRLWTSFSGNGAKAHEPEPTAWLGVNRPGTRVTFSPQLAEARPMDTAGITKEDFPQCRETPQASETTRPVTSGCRPGSGRQ